MNKIFIISGFILMIFVIACSENYENHSLAFRNNTADTIVVKRYLSNYTNPRIFTILPGEYSKIYETSTDLWITPSVELQKNADSVFVEGEINNKSFIIIFRKENADNYCLNPYSDAAEWETEIRVEEYPKLFGKKLERFYIHIFNINPQCISLNE